MSSVRILESADPYGADLPLDSGDAITVASTPSGSVLLSLDDVDDTAVPTGRLLPAEADRLALMLQAAARRARRDAVQSLPGQ